MLAHVGVYHCFARSGGTLVNRLLGASRDVLVLSEVGPAASVREPVDQAVDWLGLVEPGDADALRSLPFGPLVADLAGRAASRGRQLVVRDFPTPCFLPGAFGEVTPSGRLETADALAGAGVVASTLVVARRAAAVYSSIRRSFGHLRSLDVDDFAVAYHGFARAVEGVPVVRYEDLTSDPVGVAPRLCQLLGVPFDPGALSAFADYRTCTGDVEPTVLSRGAVLREIRRLDDPVDDPAFTAAAAHPLCRAADEILGFEPIGKPATAWTAVSAYESALSQTRAFLAQTRAALGAALVDAESRTADRQAAVDRADAAEDETRRLASELAGTLAHVDRLEAALAESHERVGALDEEMARLRRAWDETTGELSRAENIAEGRRRQIERLLEQQF